VPSLGTSFGRGGATTFQQDLQNSDCIVIQGSNMAEAHPVGFQWVMEAKARGATVIHVDPRYTRTSALADIHVNLRAGSDIAFLGGLINYVLSNDLQFTEYVKAYTNASVILREDYRDTEDLDGVFSGYQPDSRTYDTSSWQYEGVEVGPAGGQREYRDPTDDSDGGDDGGSSGGGGQHEEPGAGHQFGSGGPKLGEGEPQHDETLQDPRCVFQVLKRHFARYTPEMVEQVCGVPPQHFLKVAEAVTRNSDRDHTTAFVYAVGWTHHTVGVQYIRTAAILQTLLGNMGRPGGGIMALRGHASIQGSTDIPTLYNLLPGYIPMPNASEHLNLDQFVESSAPSTGFWGNMRSYTVSLLKAYWGDYATAANDFAFDYLPRLTGDHSSYQTVLAQIEGTCKGYFLFGENPSVGHANSKLQRKGLTNLDWLVVRDFSLIESATWWKDGPEIETGEARTEDIKTEVFFLPAAAHTEKAGSFTNTQRLLQWRHKAVEPQDDQRSDLWFIWHLGRKIREKLAASTDEMDKPVQHLTWDYPTEGEHADPDVMAVVAEINGWDADGKPLSGYTALKDDGSTVCGCWIYCGCYADGVNQMARRKPADEQSWVAPEWGWAWPMNRRMLYNRASADPEGKPWSNRKAYVWWDGRRKKWVGHDVPDFTATKPPDYEPPEGATADDAIAGTDPFIMQADGRAWLYVPTGLTDGPLPTHYEPHESPFVNPLYAQQSNPARQVMKRRDNLSNPSGIDPGSEVFPFVWTTYRLTEHHTAGGMSRWVPYLSELQPEMFCEISPELAELRGLQHLGWATITTARNAIEARVMVTDRMAPLRVQGKLVHQVGLPYHWGPNGYVTGDAANELIGVALDPNVHIQESKVGSCDIQPGRRPRGPALLDYVEGYRRRAGITIETGQEGATTPAVDGGAG
jgi:formate dehydrogenase major subunit